MRLSPAPLRDCPLTLALSRGTPLHATGLVEESTRFFILPAPIHRDEPHLIEVNGAPVESSIRQDGTLEIHCAPLDRGDIVRVWYATAPG